MVSFLITVDALGFPAEFHQLETPGQHMVLVADAETVDSCVNRQHGVRKFLDMTFQYEFINVIEANGAMSGDTASTESWCERTYDKHLYKVETSVLTVSAKQAKLLSSYLYCVSRNVIARYFRFLKFAL